MFQSDSWILEECSNRRPLINPFQKSLIRQVEGQKIISSGLSSYGYDCRLSPEGFKIFSPIHAQLIDPKRFDSNNLIEQKATRDGNDLFFVLPSHCYALAVTVEEFNMLDRLTALVLNKSTYVRCGIVVCTTVIEAGWRGKLVLEIYNAATVPVKLYANEGIAQILFSYNPERCHTSYDDRNGKYQDQKGITEAKI